MLIILYKMMTIFLFFLCLKCIKQGYILIKSINGLKLELKILIYIMKGMIFMKTYKMEDFRDIAVMGHGKCGKTTLTEAMLFNAGATDRV